MTGKPQRSGVGRHRSRRGGAVRRNRRMAVYPAATVAGLVLLCGVDQATLTEPAASARPGTTGARGAAVGTGADPAGAAGSAVADGPGVPGGSPMFVGDYRPLPVAFGIPATVLDAYRRAAAAQAQSDPACRVDWTLLAGIGKVESNHARGGDVAANGDVLHPILGPVLDGSPGTAAVPNTAGTAWDQGGAWSRAVGPMQFLPSTWTRWGAGGNPENVYDASSAAARYLCSGGGDLSTPGGQATAIYSYNHSASYVALVERWTRTYQQGGVAVPDQPGAVDLSGFLPPASDGQDDRVAPQPATPAPSAPAPTVPPAPPAPPAKPVNPAPPASSGGQPPAPGLPVVGSVPGVVGAVTAALAPAVTAVNAALPPALRLPGLLSPLLPTPPATPRP